MKRFFVIMISLLAIMTARLSAEAQEVTIRLLSGWNYISYPYPTSVSLDTFFSSITPMQGDVIKSQTNRSTYIDGTWRGAVKNLNPGVGYHYYSNNPDVVTLVLDYQIVPEETITVTTGEATDITAESATIGGDVTLLTDTHVFMRGVCWGTTSDPDIDGSYFLDGAGEGSFTVTLDELTPNTTYYVRAYAVSDHGLAYGKEQSFTTMNGIPTVITAPVTDVLGDGATCGGTVTDDGGLAITARGVCWGTEPEPTIADAHTTDGTGMGDFISILTDLDLNTTYYVRAYATTTQTTAYGEEMSFTTMNGIPSVTTAMVSNITSNGATCGGTVTSDGGLAIIARGVCWSTSQNPTIIDSHSDDGTGTGYFVSALVGLEPNTTYYVRAYATNSYVTVYGNRRSFTTQALPSYSVSVTVNPIEGGTVTGGATYEQGQSCTLTATANDGYTFTNWTENDEVVSTEATYTFTVTGDRTLVANFTLNGGTVPTGAINGLFSVSADQQVYFSQGNLQYQASTDTWKFAKNQYDYVGSGNSNISSSYSGWIDLFGWGTSGWNSGNTYYHPWDSNNSSGSTYGPPGQYNLTGLYANADWGVYNPISNGGNQTNQWRTLTKAEWTYVFNTRTTTSGIRYAKAKVNNVNGVILLPDDWSTNTYSLSNTNTSNASFSSNTISASQWNFLEQAGAVFLPAAGSRNGTSVSNVGYDGYYWSASYNSSSGAYIVYFYDSGLGTNYYNNRYYGRSVRLVCPAEN